ncbi:hypothetical protein NQT62_10085 [Limnobacter humi]|uniref:Uncharacterized protein n=1 Tax=Limnobacter humi TaxID=1778671 RepID=A0ABT1WH20_9BURK|nr:hypothetical protein [Limnobacter humi]MCQ8896780.1 hypothetical protein [Limnobacter humi]
MGLKQFTLIAGGLLIVSINVSLAKDTELTRCRFTQYAEADHKLSDVTSWQDLYRWYFKFKRCDDGYLAEGIGDTVGVLLTDQWNDLSELIAITSKDEAFLTFVLQHVNSTLDTEMLETIESNATNRCNNRFDDVCQQLRDVSHAAQN